MAVNTSMKTALITGVGGQDGSYLAELLLDQGYAVHGLVRRSSGLNRDRIDGLGQAAATRNLTFELHYGNLIDPLGLQAVIGRVKPDEIYNLASESHVGISFDEPELTGDITGLGTTRMLEALRASKVEARFYQACSSEMFGHSPPPQNETTAFRPVSPYGTAKTYAYFIAQNYRDSYGMFVANGILFNHESPRRGETFVTRKIAKAAARIAAGLEKTLYLGNLEAVRDWGYAPEYVDAMWRMLQADEPDDFVIATGTAHSVRDFAEYSFAHLGLDWEEHVEFDPHYLRPTEPNSLVGDASKAAAELGWKPQVLTPELATLMVDAEKAAIEAAALRP
jgi:GDPmannose 4,6-dehydratase